MLYKMIADTRNPTHDTAATYPNMSPLGWIAFMLTVLLLQCECQGHWDNDWDGDLNFHCPSASQAITRVESVHNNYKEDRRFELGCTYVKVKSGRKSCYWSNYVSSYDELIHFTCKSNYYINGMMSHHSNHHEDRMWKFRCCSLGAHPLKDCTLTGWTNSWDQRQHFEAPTGHVIKGVVSIHSNHKEDRLWEYFICKLGDHEEARTTTLLDYLRQKSQEAPREMTLDDYPRLDTQEELPNVSEDESREANLLPEQESRGDSQDEFPEESSVSKDESYED